MNSKILILLVASLVAAMSASAGNKGGPPYDGDEDKDNGLGNNPPPNVDNDMGTGVDASDNCAFPSPRVSGTFSGKGNLTLPDDEEDAYALEATAGTYLITIRAEAGTMGVGLEIWTPGCTAVYAVGQPDVTGALVAVFTIAPGQEGTYPLRVLPDTGDEVATSSTSGTLSEPSCWPSCLVTYALDGARS